MVIFYAGVTKKHWRKWHRPDVMSEHERFSGTKTNQLTKSPSLSIWVCLNISRNPPETTSSSSFSRVNCNFYALFPYFFILTAIFQSDFPCFFHPIFKESLPALTHAEMQRFTTEVSPKRTLCISSWPRWKKTYGIWLVYSSNNHGL